MYETVIIKVMIPVVAAATIAFSSVPMAIQQHAKEVQMKQTVVEQHEEGYTTVVDKNGDIVKLPYEHNKVITKDDGTKGIIGKTFDKTIDIGKWVWKKVTP